MKKILFYYHHFGGLGHGTRILSICRAIKAINPDYNLLVINSGKPQPELGIAKFARVANLPYFEAKGGFSGLESKEGLNLTFDKRKKILNKLAGLFKPDIAIFEHYPFGRRFLDDELSFFIKNLKGQNCKVYSSVRDIIEQEVDTDKLEENLDLFNGVLVHSEKEFITNFEQSKKLKDKLFFTGRVVNDNFRLSSDTIRHKLGCKDKKLIVASIGGGIDGVELLERLIRIKNDLDKRFNSLLLISTGKMISQEQYKILTELAKEKKGILLTRFNSNYLDYVAAADLSISMAGYNSLNNALITGVPTLFFPRLTDKEQQIRANKLGFEVLNYETISDMDLFNKIGDRIAEKSVDVKHYNGAVISARFLDYALNLNHIKIRLTTKCNLNCDMCSWEKVEDQDFSFDQVISLISQAKLLGVDTINFTGGEPTLYPGLEKLLAYAKSLNLNTSLSTNGNLESDKLNKLIPYLDGVDISLDSYHSDLNDKIRGVKGAFDNALNSIKVLNDKNIDIHINVTVRPDNFRGIHKMLPLLSKFINSISFTLVDSTINKMDSLIFSKEELESFYFDELLEILKECINGGIGVRITPFFENLIGLKPEEVLNELLFNKDRYVNNVEGAFLGNTFDCSGSVRINSVSNISPCCYLDDAGIDIGSLENKPLLELLTSDDYFSFIKGIGVENCVGCGYKAYQKWIERSKV